MSFNPSLTDEKHTEGNEKKSEQYERPIISVKMIIEEMKKGKNCNCT